MMRSIFYCEGFFIEDNYDIEGNNVQCYMCNFLIVQQLGGDSDQCYNINNGQQQVMVVDRFEVWF